MTQKPPVRYNAGEIATALTAILQTSAASTQEELRGRLEKQGYEVTQSTVSRTLRKLKAIKTTDRKGRTVYRLPTIASAPSGDNSISSLVRNVSENGYLIVVHTIPGSAQFVAQHLDYHRPANILGTVAGDDTIFIAPISIRSFQQTFEAVKEALRPPQEKANL